MTTESSLIRPVNTRTAPEWKWMRYANALEARVAELEAESEVAVDRALDRAVPTPPDCVCGQPARWHKDGHHLCDECFAAGKGPR